MAIEVRKMAMKRVTPRPPQHRETSERESPAAGISQREPSREQREQAELPPRGQRKNSEKPTPEQQKPQQPPFEDDLGADAVRELEDED
jgi:hypothetical protein